jgi:PIN domain nuclease of toxin-antitoxin system
VPFLLNTNILLWYVLEPDRLSSAILKILATDSERLYFSAAGALEIGKKYSIGKLALPSPPINFIECRLSGYFHIACFGGKEVATASVRSLQAASQSLRPRPEV